MELQEIKAIVEYAKSSNDYVDWTLIEIFEKYICEKENEYETK